MVVEGVDFYFGVLGIGIGIGELPSFWIGVTEI